MKESINDEKCKVFKYFFFSFWLLNQFRQSPSRPFIQEHYKLSPECIFLKSILVYFYDWPNNHICHNWFILVWCSVLFFLFENRFQNQLKMEKLAHWNDFCVQLKKASRIFDEEIIWEFLYFKIWPHFKREATNPLESIKIYLILPLAFIHLELKGFECFIVEVFIIKRETIFGCFEIMS